MNTPTRHDPYQSLRFRDYRLLLNGLFVNASNQLGGFESGLTAQLFGPTLSVAGGGVGTIVVVLVVALLWPELRRLRALREVSGNLVEAQAPQSVEL